MNDINPLKVVDRLLTEIHDSYLAVSDLSFSQERIYILEMARKLDKKSQKMVVAEEAVRNPVAFKSAVLHQGAIGLSLSPATHWAYLVVRSGQVVFDISYQGLLKLATDAGSIRWAKAELIYEKDRFEYQGPVVLPKHVPDILNDDRGAFRGVYCVAKTGEGDILTEVLTAQDIYDIRDCSRAQNGPWKQFFGEMAKKAAFKRASKTWPKSGGDDRLFKAIQLLNEHEGLIKDEGVQISESEPADEATSNSFPDAAGDTSFRPSQELSNRVDRLIDKFKKTGNYKGCLSALNKHLIGEELDYAVDRLEKANAERKAA
jgi:recombination protein RecT